MNEHELLASISRIATRGGGAVDKCEAAFRLIGDALRGFYAIPVSREFKKKLRECVERLYGEAIEEQARQGFAE